MMTRFRSKPVTKSISKIATTVVLAALLALSGQGDAFAKNDKAKGGGAKGGGKPAAAGGQSGGSNLDKAISGAAAAVVTAAGAALADSLLSPEDRRTIEQFYKTQDTKAKSLPPGIAKNLERGKPLPPGIAKTRAPGALTGKIKVPNGYELTEVGTDVLLIEAGTEIIVEVLKGVLAK